MQIGEHMYEDRRLNRLHSNSNSVFRVVPKSLLPIEISSLSIAIATRSVHYQDLMCRLCLSTLIMSSTTDPLLMSMLSQSTPTYEAKNREKL
ncbi:zinc finger MYM-type protein 1-like [Iris pallida]|uniref:Zinc finger MYM-type protein 1-like n=1 Tax=Iris pallida TaxID=29817 RepID=A0AAX6EIS2_IRIPA|nr:zinc finger MYM-type protein 1-like [Iris pallida]